MQRDAEFFGDAELDLVYIARKLKEALQLEEKLTAAGIDYLVEADNYRGGFIFQTERVGAFFYVAPAQSETVRDFLVRNRYRPYTPGSF